MQKKLILLVLFVLLFVGGCRKPASNSHPFFIKAQNSFDKGDYKNAVKLYRKYLRINPCSAKAIYQLAVIYQEQEEYISAIFYYRQYLELEPNSGDKKLVEKWIEFSKRKLFEQLWRSETGFEVKAKLEKELSDLRERNKKLRDFIIKHQNVVYAPHSEVTTQNHQSENSGKHVYTIKYGDTLSKISEKFYGTPKYYDLIIQANTGINSSTTLIPGDKLTIPPKPK